MDGRTTIPATNFIRETFRVDYVDTVTKPGPVKILAEKADGVEDIRRMVEISVTKHGSKVITIDAHPDCAGNPVDDVVQIAELRKAKETIESWGFPARVFILWVS
jgi:hypothetical protein